MGKAKGLDDCLARPVFMRGEALKEASDED